MVGNFHSSTRTSRHNHRSLDSTKHQSMLDAFGSISNKPMQTDVASLIELPGRMKGEVAQWHMDATDMMRQRIGTIQLQAKHKVSAIEEYMDIMQKLDVQISMVTNNQESSGDVSGTIRVLSDSIQQYNEKYALFCDFEQQCQQTEADIEKTRQDMKKMLADAKKLEADDVHKKLVDKYVHDQSENSQIV